MGQTEDRFVYRLSGWEVTVHMQEKLEYRKKFLTICSFLPSGKENAISTQELMQRIGCKSARDLQVMISREREAGAIICSGAGSGYWLPANEKEIRDFIRMTTNRARNTFKATLSARKYLKEMQQKNLEGSEQ